MSTKWLTFLKSSLAWAMLAFFILAIALLLHTFISDRDMLRIIERVSRTNLQAQEKLVRMLGAESIEQFEEFANSSHDRPALVTRMN